MSQIKFYQIDQGDEIDNLMHKYVALNGWEYDEDYKGHCVVGLKITDPHGKEWSLEEAIKTLEDPLSMEDENQVIALKATEFFNILYNWGYWDRKQLEQLGILEK